MTSFGSVSPYQLYLLLWHSVVVQQLRRVPEEYAIELQRRRCVFVAASLDAAVVLNVGRRAVSHRCVCFASRRVELQESDQTSSRALQLAGKIAPVSVSICLSVCPSLLPICQFFPSSSIAFTCTGQLWIVP